MVFAGDPVFFQKRTGSDDFFPYDGGAFTGAQLVEGAQADIDQGPVRDRLREIL